MNHDILEVCKELDGLMIRALELMEEQIKCKLKLQEIMKSGCLELAKTRYIMGNHNVSYLQLPTEGSAEITALRTVASSVETKNNLEHMIFELHTLSPQKKSQGKQEENNLRNRADKDDDERKEADDLNHKKACESKNYKCTYQIALPDVWPHKQVMGLQVLLSIGFEELAAKQVSETTVLCALVTRMLLNWQLHGNEQCYQQQQKEILLILNLSDVKSKCTSAVSHHLNF
ncbi:hypothetical protein L798_09282 [Zootermopsis nevadensis]|uniref:Vacuolar ATPase assembly protein VMA22 n=1 Tax=Zootermopsis nevadensis TaxID=136037 RepID=A0A067RAQ1_ZOONE|nr:hypothetical protein L798_09282 [Zootermopsis nevadensis]